MNPAELQQPIVDGGIRSVNFFNGRMLTARDLTREQAANREVDRRLGQAVGEGIAYGLEVSKSTGSTNESPVVSVEPGLAVNRQGQTLWLQDQTDVALVRKASASATEIFAECKPLQSGTYVAGAGVYLLTVAPAETREGRAVTSALNTGGAPCNTDAVVSAVQFRLIQLDPPITATELLDQNHLRNLIAYKCFGVADTQSFVSDPFGSELKQYGLLDSLRSNLLTDCDVPLGVLYWTLTDGIKFIDMWSVRRRLARRVDVGRYALLQDDRRAREGEAMFLQFQEQLEALRIFDGNPEALTAKSRFRYLPPIGILPLRKGGSAGFTVSRFFDGVAHRNPEFIDGALLNALTREAINYDPINLLDPIDPDSCEMVWLYSAWQNERATQESSTQPYVVFTSGHVPYAATARFDVTRWDYGNYS
jgi:hypothetical protein